MMKLICDRIRSDRYLQAVERISAELGVKIYFVGGGLRDILLGRKLHDLDFALSGSPEAYPRMFAELIGGSFFWLDWNRLQSRVVKRAEEGEDGLLTFDFAPLRGEDIGEDLSLRDFTVNAMAVDLTGEPRLIDPMSGSVDLRSRKIRICSARSFDDDPLRLLRSVRLAAVLQFDIEEETFHRMLEKAPLLVRPAAERVRDELFQILAATDVGASLRILHHTGLMPVLFPEGLWEQVPEEVLLPQIVKAERMEQVTGEVPRTFPHFSQAIAAHLAGELEGGVTSLSLLKLAAFTGAAGMGDAQAWAARLKLGKKGARMLTLLHRDRVPLLSVLSSASGRRAAFRFFRDNEPSGLELLLLALSMDELPEVLCSELVEYYFTEYDSCADELLLSGEEVMALVGVGPGPAVGEALERLRDAESRGLVNNKEEAREFLRKNLLTKERPML